MGGDGARRAQPADHGAAVDALASAFSTDPLLLWMMREPADAEERLVHLFTSILHTELDKVEHWVYVRPDGEAAAIWRGIDDWETPTAQLVRAAPTLLRVFGRGVPRALRVVGAVAKAHPDEPHYYLEFVGTHASRQRQGLGSALLAPMLARCDEEGTPAYLENSNPRNEAFYARHGFVSRGPVSLPDGAPPVSAMWRDPR